MSPNSLHKGQEDEAGTSNTDFTGISISTTFIVIVIVPLAVAVVMIVRAVSRRLRQHSKQTSANFLHT